MRRETAFRHEALRQMPPPDNDSEGKRAIASTLLDQWVRVTVTDGRTFVGPLKAIDDAMNMVISCPVEVRPTREAGKEETKGHRSCVMIKGTEVVSVKKRKKQPAKDVKEGQANANVVVEAVAADQAK